MFALNGWRIEVKNLEEIKYPELSEESVVSLINQKYPGQMWNDKWRDHMNFHQESGKRKCLIASIPEITLTVVSFSRWNRELCLLGLLSATGKRGLSCYEKCGKFKVSVPPIYSFLLEFFEPIHMKFCCELIGSFTE
jgi:hypothetical protein